MDVAKTQKRKWNGKRNGMEYRKCYILLFRCVKQAKNDIPSGFFSIKILFNLLFSISPYLSVFI